MLFSIEAAPLRLRTNNAQEFWFLHFFFLEKCLFKPCVHLLISFFIAIVGVLYVFWILIHKIYDFQIFPPISQVAFSFSWWVLWLCRGILSHLLIRLFFLIPIGGNSLSIFLSQTIVGKSFLSVSSPLKPILYSHTCLAVHAPTGKKRQRGQTQPLM